MRCYNGAWDSAALALFAKEGAVLNEIRTSEPEAWCTYFPNGEFWTVHVWGRELGEGPTKLAALENALANVKAKASR